MAPNYVTVGGLRSDLPVESLGEQPDRVVVYSEELRSRGVALWPGHPGRISHPALQHVQVSWVGLEDEPASYALGCTPDSLAADGRYLALGVLSEAEFSTRSSALTEALRSMRDLTDWVPPWSHADWVSQALEIRRPELHGVRRSGIVRWFKEENGYGRITADDGEVLLVHFSSIEIQGYRSLDPGERVTFVWAGGKHAHGRHIAEAVRRT